MGGISTVAKIDTSAPREAVSLGGRLEEQASPFGLDPAFAERVMMTQRQMADMSLMMAREMMDFATRRFRAQAEFVESLTRCGDPQQLMETQLRFLAQTSSDYADEMSHIAKAVRTTAAANEAMSGTKAA
jgi:hypothetical protein